jgi:hypothetical protein
MKRTAIERSILVVSIIMTRESRKDKIRHSCRGRSLYYLYKSDLAKYLQWNMFKNTFAIRLIAT